MKKNALLLLAGALLASPMTFADNIIRMSAPIKDGASTWQRISDKVSDWRDVGAVYSCSNWSPPTDTIAIGQPFTQVASDCLQAHEKTVQGREQNVKTQEIRNVGAVRIMSETYTTQSSRDAVGSSAGSWNSIASVVSDWSSVGTPTNCTNWSPTTISVAQGTTFTQTATDCLQVQEQTIQAREQNSVSGEIRNSGTPQVSQKTISVSQTRDAVGTKTSNTDVYTMRGYFYGTFLNSTILTSVSPNNNQLISFAVNGNSGKVEFLSGAAYKPSDIKSLKWEMMDNNGVVQYTTTQTAIVFTAGGYMGWSISAQDNTASGAWLNWRVSITY